MRIYGPNGTTLGTPCGERETHQFDRLFAAGHDIGPRRPRSSIAPKATANIDALLALQGVEEDPVERRKRSVAARQGRARRAG